MVRKLGFLRVALDPGSSGMAGGCEDFRPAPSRDTFAMPVARPRWARPSNFSVRRSEPGFHERSRLLLHRQPSARNLQSQSERSVVPSFAARENRPSRGRQAHGQCHLDQPLRSHPAREPARASRSGRLEVDSALRFQPAHSARAARRHHRRRGARRRSER